MNYFRNSIIQNERLSTKKNRFNDSIFSDVSKLSELFIEKDDDFEVSNLWEDYGKNHSFIEFQSFNKEEAEMITDLKIFLLLLVD